VALSLLTRRNNDIDQFRLIPFDDNNVNKIDELMCETSGETAATSPTPIQSPVIESEESSSKIGTAGLYPDSGTESNHPPADHRGHIK